MSETVFCQGLSSLVARKRFSTQKKRQKNHLLSRRCEVNFNVQRNKQTIYNEEDFFHELSRPLWLFLRQQVCDVLAKGSFRCLWHTLEITDSDDFVGFASNPLKCNLPGHNWRECLWKRNPQRNNLWLLSQYLVCSQC